jgi:hypothetical protein
MGEEALEGVKGQMGKPGQQGVSPGEQKLREARGSNFHDFANSYVSFLLARYLFEMPIVTLAWNVKIPHITSHVEKPTLPKCHQPVMAVLRKVSEHRGIPLMGFEAIPCFASDLPKALTLLPKIGMKVGIGDRGDIWVEPASIHTVFGKVGQDRLGAGGARMSVTETTQKPVEKWAIVKHVLDQKTFIDRAEVVGGILENCEGVLESYQAALTLAMDSLKAARLGLGTFPKDLEELEAIAVVLYKRGEYLDTLRRAAGAGLRAALEKGKEEARR